MTAHAAASPSAFVILEGGPRDGDVRRLEVHVLGGWPPVLTLPGVFRGGGYIRSDWETRPFGEARKLEKVVTYAWRPF